MFSYESSETRRVLQEFFNQNQKSQPYSQEQQSQTYPTEPCQPRSPSLSQGQQTFSLHNSQSFPSNIQQNSPKQLIHPFTTEQQQQLIHPYSSEQQLIHPYSSEQQLIHPYSTEQHQQQRLKTTKQQQQQPRNNDLLHTEVIPLIFLFLFGGDECKLLITQFIVG